MNGTQLEEDRWTERLIRDHDRRHAYDGQTGAAFRSWQAAFRSDLESVLGFPVIEEATIPDLDPVHREREQQAGYEHQLWRIRTERELTLPFYLHVPDDPEPPYPVAVTLHGHTDLGKDLPAGRCDPQAEPDPIAEQRRNLAVQAVERGYAAVVPDMRAFGALRNPADDDRGYRGCHTLQLREQLFGRSLVGDRVWDVTRLLSFVDRRTDLDEDCVVLTGHSGGGAVALFTGAVDERPDVVAPCCYCCSFEASIAAVDHCECNYVPGVLGLGELWDVAGLIAPRPFVAVAGADDDIFPIEGVRRAFERLRVIYDAVGAADDCELHVGDGGHRYFPEGVWPFADAHL